ncbi:MAG: CotH kinase family protein, partial [Planctomycetales bacterium]|nr:CotH kinase family protein [Planctomycetales bacterium]
MTDRRSKQGGSARRSGTRWMLGEPLEERAMLAAFTAYNGLFSSNQTSPNTTFYSAINAVDNAGPLKDVVTGADQAAILSTAHVGAVFDTNGTQPANGTDAAEIFGGFVDFSAGSQRSIEIGPGAAYEYRFENLDPGATYQFAGTAIRGNSSYTDRWTLAQIEGAESFTIAHSSGAGVVTAGLEPNQVAFWAGHNAASDQGYVVQWLDIDPGPDGQFTVISTQYTGSIPTAIDANGVADGSKSYGIAGVRLTQDEASGPPAVENVPATDVLAFNATIGGTITTTGGEVPEVTLYFGTTDGGTNAAAWQHAVPLGNVSGEFSTVLDSLTQNTTYHYRGFAQNSLGSAWAPTTSTLQTLPASAPVIVNRAVENVGAFSAVLNGTVTDTGNDLPIVTVYYGDNDGGTNPNAWDHHVDIGTQFGAFSLPVSNLQPLTNYYFTTFAQNSLGSDWAPATLQFATTDTPPLQISEFMADNSATLTTRTRVASTVPFAGDVMTPDWIEIHNPTDTVADIGGFHLTDTPNSPQKWAFPAGTVVPPNGYLVVYASGLDIVDTALDQTGRLHTSFELSGDGSDRLLLTDADGERVAGFDTIPLQSEDISYGIDLLGEERFYGVPTPGSNNANDVPPAPVISVASKTFTGSFTVELTASLPTHSIRYTTDERTPTTTSTLYTGPITISSTTQLRAIAVSPDGKVSTVVSASYVSLGANVLNRTSNLPIMIVETFGDSVPGVGSTYGDSFMALIEPGEDGVTVLTDAFDLTTRGGIHVRGSSSSGFAKKQYRVEFWDENNEDQKQSVLGMPKEADWIFYGPNQYDRVLISNPLMFDLSNQMGRYATRTRWVEMYLDSNGGTLDTGDFVGLYAITEVIEEGDDRVDVGTLTTGAGGVPVQGGFIWKNDRGNAYVDPESPTTQQRTYINSWINGLSSAAAGANFTDPVNGYAKYADVPSFIDHNILNMVSMNVDALRLSSFYFKRPDGKLEAGPIWDFDRALDSTDGRDNNPRSWFGTGDSTRYFDDNDRVRSWWPDMFQDPDFVQAYIDRWFDLRQGVLSLDNINATIDRIAEPIFDAAARDYQRWSGSRYTNFAGELNHLKTWLRQRV